MAPSFPNPDFDVRDGADRGVPRWLVPRPATLARVLCVGDFARVHHRREVEVAYDLRTVVGVKGERHVVVVVTETV